MHPRTITPVDPAQLGAAIPLAPLRAPAGFPSPSQDYITDAVALDELLIQDKAATFLVEVTGHSMEQAGISDGDVLLVEKGRQAHHGNVVLAVLDGEMTIKRLIITARGVMLKAENAAHPDIVVPELSELVIWGVARFCLHRLAA